MPFQLLESEPAPGGLARSETRDGFTFDLAGHWLHLRDPAVRALFDELLGPDLLEIERASWIHLGGRWVPYPLQTNLWALPADACEECLTGYVRARLRQVRRDPALIRPADFHEAVLRAWGEGIARHFVVPYNEKLWGFPLRELVPEWAGRFLPDPAVDEIVRGAVGRGEAAGYNARFLYPRHGGIGLVARRLGEQVAPHMALDSRVVAVDVRARRLRLDDGRDLRYEHLVSTIPLPALVRACVDPPVAVAAAARGLRAVAVRCVNVAVRGETPPGVPVCHWAYFPEARFPYYRVGCGPAAVPSLAPAGCRSFSVEFGDAHNAAAPALEDDAVAGLKACGLIGADDEVLFTFTRTVPGAYVVRDRDCEPRRRTVLGWLARHHVHSVGRYGGWQYGSMEDAFLEGQHAASRIVNDAAALRAHG